MNREILLKNNVDVDAALSLWGDMDSYNESLKEYHDSLEEKLSNLEKYKNAYDFENYGILAHSLKSEAKYLGFMQESEVFLTHEMAGKGKDMVTMSGKFQELSDTVHKIIAVIDAYFGNKETKEKTILVADDSEIMLNFIEQHLKEKYNIIRANNGNEAINAIKVQSIYALLLDLNMPGINGFEVLEFIRNNGYSEKIPVVIITGDDTEETIQKAFTYPIVDVLNKPFTESNIERVLVAIEEFYKEK